MDRENVEYLALAAKRLRTTAGMLRHRAKAVETQAVLIEKTIGLDARSKSARRNAAIVTELAQGARIIDVARRHRLSPGRVSQIRKDADKA